MTDVLTIQARLEDRARQEAIERSQKHIHAMPMHHGEVVIPRSAFISQDQKTFTITWSVLRPFIRKMLEKEIFEEQLEKMTIDLIKMLDNKPA